MKIIEPKDLLPCEFCESIMNDYSLHISNYFSFTPYFMRYNFDVIIVTSNNKSKIYSEVVINEKYFISIVIFIVD